MISWQSMLERWFGSENNYKIHPTSVSRRVGEKIGYGSKTSTDIPRNYILINYGNWYPIIVFNLILWIYNNIGI